MRLKNQTDNSMSYSELPLENHEAHDYQKEVKDVIIEEEVKSRAKSEHANKIEGGSDRNGFKGQLTTLHKTKKEAYQ